jgi:iron complex outermembrane receptor protein
LPNHALRLASLVFGLSASSLAGAYELFLDNPPLPEVLTATRLHQAPAAVPGSISVIDRQLIQASGARELTELLRLVPGMLVIPEGSATNVNYHGGLGAGARRLQVLVDGRSVYRPALAQVDWVDIPVALEDIERIEVFRGPNTVSYGANALLGVINIITQKPSDSQGSRLSYTTGKRGIEDWYARQGFGWENGAMRVSLSGFDHDRFDLDRRGNDFPDSQRLSRFNLRANHELNSQHSFDWQLALKDGINQEPNYELITGDALFKNHATHEDAAIVAAQAPRTEIQARDYAASLRWNLDLSPHHSLSVLGAAQHWERLQEWRACFETGLSAPAYSCGLINKNSRETRYDLEIQDILSLSDNLRIISGAGYRHDAVDSETFFNGSRSKDIVRLFGQFEWYMNRHWLLQGGAMYEDDSMIGDSLSPRLALNYLFYPGHGLRVVYSEAVRSPDMFEEAADWQFYIRDLTPAIMGQTAMYYPARSKVSGGLVQERIISRELGYNGHFSSLGLHLDLRLFNEDITDLITHWPEIGNFSPGNDDRLSFKGWEAEGDWRLGLRDRLRLSYAYIEFEATHHYDSELTPRHSGSLSWLRDWSRGWNSGLTYLGANSLNTLRFERVDLYVSKRLQVGSTQTTLSGTWQQRLDDNHLGGRNTNYRQRHVFWLSAGLEI